MQVSPVLSGFTAASFLIASETGGEVYAFDEFGERLSAAAQANLAQAVTFVRSAIEADEFHEIHKQQEHRRERHDARG